jgi:hypothetical protein
MRQKSHSSDLSSEEIVKGIRRATRRRKAMPTICVLIFPPSLLTC